MPADCTQGLVVALSTGEPAGATALCQKGATAAIGCRVGLDGTGKTVGFAGLEGLQAPGSLGPTINGAAYTPQNIRDAQQPYPLARRLFLQDRADPERPRRPAPRGSCPPSRPCSPGCATAATWTRSC